MDDIDVEIGQNAEDTAKFGIFAKWIFPYLWTTLIGTIVVVAIGLVLLNTVFAITPVAH